MFLLKNESMYLIDDQKIIDFQTLLQSHRYLSNSLTDFKRGYSFQLQVVFDLYTFLTTDQQQLYPNLFCNFERPLHAYLHELLSRQKDFKQFKRLHITNHLLALIISVFVTKKVIASIQQHIIEQDTALLYENPLELIIPLTNSSTNEEPPINLIIQSYILKKMKARQMTFDYFEPIVTSSIQSAKELELLLKKENY